MSDRGEPGQGLRASPLRRALAGLRAHEGQRETVQEPGTGAGAPTPLPADPLGETQLVPEERGFAAPSPDAPGRVGGYRVVGELGRGGAGVVYVARSEKLDRLVALKLLRAERAEQAEMRERFEIEARSAARLRHPNIVGIHEVGEDGPGRPFLVMELVPGRSLARHLREEGPLPAREAARVAARLARALAYAHGRGVLHRDVKPANVLLSPEGEPLLTDFGLAKVLNEDQASTPTVTGQVMGTPAYMPPEQARGEAVDVRSDVYSLGATLYELLCGRPPFDAPSVAAILTRVSGPDPATAIGGLVRDLDRDLATVCMRALEKDPADRYRGAAELAEDLERWLRDEPVLARAPGLLERARKWLRRNPAAARSLAASLVVATGVGLTGGVLFLHRLERERDRARTEADRAQLEAARARAAARQARLALDALINEVQEQLADLPGEDVRRTRARLLEQAAARLAELAALRVGGREEVTPAELARRLGTLALAAGETARALEHLERSVALTRQLAGAHPDMDQLAWDLVTTLAMRADALNRAGQDSRALADLEEAAGLLRGALRARRWDGVCALRAGQVLCRLSETRRYAGDRAGSLSAGLEALGLAFARPDLAEPARSQACSEALSAVGRALVMGEHPQRALPFFEAALTLDRRRVAGGASWQGRRALLVALLDLSDLALSTGLPARGGPALEEALPLARGLLAADPQGVEARRSLFMCLERRASWALDEGRLDEALAHAREALELIRSTAPADAAAVALRDDASAAIDLLGQVHERRGELEEARARYEEALALDRAHLAQDASSEGRLRVLNGLERLFEVRRALGDRAGAAAVCEEGEALLARLSDPPWGVRSVFLMQRAHLRLDAGDLDGAGGPLEEALRVRRAALEAEPTRLLALHGLGSALMAHSDLRAAQGDLAGAEASLAEGVAVLRRGLALAPRDLGLRRALGSTLVRLGGLHRQQDRAELAQRAWEEALALRRDLAAEDENPSSRRDVLVLLSRLAELRQAGGDPAGARQALEEVLVAQRELGGEPGATPGARRDLAVALLKAGDARQAAGEAEPACAVYAEAVTLLAELAASDRSDVAGQRELFAGAQRLLQASVALRRLDQALEAAEHLLSAARAAAAAQGDAPAPRRDVSIALLKRADVRQARGEREAALADLRAAVENHRALVPDAPRYAPELERMEAMLAAYAAGE